MNRSRLLRACGVNTALSSAKFASPCSSTWRCGTGAGRGCGCGCATGAATGAGCGLPHMNVISRGSFIGARLYTRSIISSGVKPLPWQNSSAARAHAFALPSSPSQLTRNTLSGLPGIDTARMS